MHPRHHLNAINARRERTFPHNKFGRYRKVFGHSNGEVVLKERIVVRDDDGLKLVCRASLCCTRYRDSCRYSLLNLLSAFYYVARVILSPCNWIGFILVYCILGMDIQSLESNQCLPQREWW